MTQYFSGIIALVLAGLTLTAGCLIFASFIYSRFMFNNYLKRRHRQKWEQMAYTEPHGFNWFSSDLTRQLWEFRCKSKDNLGDPNIDKMRKLSIYLFKSGIIVWLSILGFFSCVAIIYGVILKGK